MRTSLMILLVAVAVTVPMSGQSPAPPSPQTARQALIEMFLGKDSADFAKHLPDAARRIFLENGGSANASELSRIATFGREMVLHGEKVETFDEGATILVSEQAEGREKILVAVEHDSLVGETEEIELSAHFFHDGQEQSLTVIPQLIFTLKQEKEIWRLIEVTAAAHIPLTDQDYLGGLRKRQQEANESAAKMRMGFIANAETGYAAKHPERGYSCMLPALFAPEPADDDSSVENEDGNRVQVQAFYDPGQANSEWNGYRFALMGCEGSPALKYQITAVPIDSDSGTKTFCADESGAVKSIEGRNGSTCFNRGEKVNPPSDSTVGSQD
jgi:hypothetical protein